MNDLNQIEQAAFMEFLARPSAVRNALEKFAAYREQELKTRATDSLRSIPRQVEEACDAAAKAEVYAGLMNDLERYANSR